MVFRKNKKKEKTNYQDLYTRVSADFQNYKRRIEKERLSWILQSQIEIVRPLLSLIDDLDRAVDSCRKQEEDASKESILAGLGLIQKNVDKTFKDLGVSEIDCTGQFNPDLHEALLEVDSSDHASGEIVEVINKGYMFKDQVMRHAKVSVAK